MKKRIFRLLGLLILVVVTVCNGCAHESEGDTSVSSSIDYDAMDALEGVRLSIEEGTLSSTGATFILYNGSDYDIRLYPEPKKKEIQVLKDSEWVNVKDGTYNMTLAIITISPSTEWKIEAPWGNSLGELPEGKYRYVRCFTSRGKEYCVTCEFEV